MLSAARVEIDGGARFTRSALPRTKQPLWNRRHQRHTVAKIRMTEEIDQDRRRLLGTATMGIAVARSDGIGRKSCRKSPQRFAAACLPPQR
jgi:hypothetical protein